MQMSLIKRTKYGKEVIINQTLVFLINRVMTCPAFSRILIAKHPRYTPKHPPKVTQHILIDKSSVVILRAYIVLNERYFARILCLERRLALIKIHVDEHCPEELFEDEVPVVESEPIDLDGVSENDYRDQNPLEVPNE